LLLLVVIDCVLSLIFALQARPPFYSHCSADSPSWV